MTRRTTLKLFALLTLTLSTAGCGGGGGTCTVTGVVKYKGKPIHGGGITLVGSNDQIAQGGIDPDGKFIVTGAPTGKLRVGVTSTKPAPPRNVDRGGGRSDPAMPAAPVADPAKWFEVDSKYADPNTSGKEITVAGGTNNVTIELD